MGTPSLRAERLFELGEDLLGRLRRYLDEPSYQYTAMMGKVFHLIGVVGTLFRGLMLGVMVAFAAALIVDPALRGVKALDVDFLGARFAQGEALTIVAAGLGLYALLVVFLAARRATFRIVDVDR